MPHSDIGNSQNLLGFPITTASSPLKSTHAQRAALWTQLVLNWVNTSILPTDRCASCLRTAWPAPPATTTTARMCAVSACSARIQSPRGPAATEITWLHSKTSATCCRLPVSGAADASCQLMKISILCKCSANNGKLLRRKYFSAGLVRFPSFPLR